MSVACNWFVQLINLKKKDGYKYLYTNYYPSLCRFSVRITQNLSESEDLVQDCFVKLWKGKVTFETEKAMVSYIYTSVRNASLNVIRDRARRKGEPGQDRTHLDTLEFNGASIQQIMIEEEVARLVYAAINKLSPERKSVIMLALDGLSNQEIARHIGISINTVKSLKLRTYRTLRKELEPAFCMFFM